MTSTSSAAATGLPLKPAPFLDPSEDLPELYALKCAGDCMAPEITDGSRVAVSKSESYSVGDLVVVWLQPEYVTPGHHQALVKRLALGVPPWVKFPYRDHPKSEALAVLGLSMNSMPGKMMMVPCAHIAAIHAAVGVMPAEIVGTKGARYRRIGGLQRADPAETRKAGAALKKAVAHLRSREAAS